MVGMLENNQQDILKGVLETAGKKSAGSISTMIDFSVEADVYNLQDAFDLYEAEMEKEDLAFIIKSELKEDRGGITFFIMPEESTRKLVNVLLEREIDERFGKFGDEELSTMKEVGNIIFGNFLGEVSDYFDTSILHEPPEIVHDMTGSFFADMIRYTQGLDEVIIAEVPFTAEDLGIEGKYILVLGDDFIQEFEDYFE
ncbi:MAG: chemotaxis protein CheC [Candidatus Thermoplasmatota archaeon]